MDQAPTAPPLLDMFCGSPGQAFRLVRFATDDDVLWASPTLPEDRSACPPSVEAEQFDRWLDHLARLGHVVTGPVDPT